MSVTPLQNDLRMAKEKARRKQAIIGRQEEELAARDSSLDGMHKEQASSSRQVDHLQEDNKALKVTTLLASFATNVWLTMHPAPLHGLLRCYDCQAWGCACSAINLLTVYPKYWHIEASYTPLKIMAS